MWSYPNLIPLSAAKVQRMAEILEPFAFDAVYGAFSGRGQIDANGKHVVAASVALYITRISETRDAISRPIAAMASASAGHFFEFGVIDRYSSGRPRQGTNRARPWSRSVRRLHHK
jgi:hypothetical protein